VIRRQGISCRSFGKFFGEIIRLRYFPDKPVTRIKAGDPAHEAALSPTPLANPAQPLDGLRAPHRFDPCLACFTRVMSPDGRDMAFFTIL
jgi:hypothetical protein